MPGAPLPAWAAGLPHGAVPPRSNVPPLKPGKTMFFENRRRALTIARLWGYWGWRLPRIGKHFGVGAERARQLVLAGGYYGRWGTMTSLDRKTWPTAEGAAQPKAGGSRRRTLALPVPRR